MNTPPDRAFAPGAVISHFSGTSPLMQSLRNSPQGIHLGNVFRGPEQPESRDWFSAIGKGLLRNWLGNAPRQMAATSPPISRFSRVSNFSTGADNTFSMLSRFRPVPNILDQMAQFSPKLAPSADLLNSISNDPFVIQQLQQSPMGDMTRYL